MSSDMLRTFEASHNSPFRSMRTPRALSSVLRNLAKTPSQKPVGSPRASIEIEGIKGNPYEHRLATLKAGLQKLEILQAHLAFSDLPETTNETEKAKEAALHDKRMKNVKKAIVLLQERQKVLEKHRESYQDRGDSLAACGKSKPGKALNWKAKWKMKSKIKALRKDLGTQLKGSAGFIKFTHEHLEIDLQFGEHHVMGLLFQELGTNLQLTPHQMKALQDKGIYFDAQKEEAFQKSLAGMGGIGGRVGILQSQNWDVIKSETPTDRGLRIKSAATPHKQLKTGKDNIKERGGCASHNTLGVNVPNLWKVDSTIGNEKDGSSLSVTLMRHACLSAFDLESSTLKELPLSDREDLFKSYLEAGIVTPEDISDLRNRGCIKDEYAQDCNVFAQGPKPEQNKKTWSQEQIPLLHTSLATGLAQEVGSIPSAYYKKWRERIAERRAAQVLSEMASSALTKNPNLPGAGTRNDPIRLPAVISLNAMSRIGKEESAIEEQTRAWKGLEGKSVLIQLDDNRKVWVQAQKALPFNFAVNDWAFAPVASQIIARKAEADNARSMEALIGAPGSRNANQYPSESIVGQKLQELRMKLNRANEDEKEKINKQIQHINLIAHQVAEIWDQGAYRDAGYDPYKMLSRLIALNMLLGDVPPGLNCKSGKDRTGFADVEAHFLLNELSETGQLPSWKEDLSDAQKMRLRTLFVKYKAGTKIQELNTSVPGYKIKGRKYLRIYETTLYKALPRRLGFATHQEYEDFIAGLSDKVGT